jgi:hypothetical protein
VGSISTQAPLDWRLGEWGDEFIGVYTVANIVMGAETPDFFFDCYRSWHGFFCWSYLTLSNVFSSETGSSCPLITCEVHGISRDISNLISYANYGEFYSFCGSSWKCQDYCVLKIVKTVENRGTWAVRNAFRILVEGNRPLGCSNIICEDNIKIEVKYFDVKLWSEFIWLWTGASGLSLCEHGNESGGLCEILVISD